jgi:hypothetical protein
MEVPPEGGGDGDVGEDREAAMADGRQEAQKQKEEGDMKRRRG